MGIAIQTYRARIGTFKNFRCGDTIGKYRLSRGSDVAALVPNINVSSDLKTVGCVIFIGVLLMISGVEPNPGPMENGSDSCQIDEVPGLVKRKETIADGSNTQHEQPNKIKLTKLSVDMNKIMLKTFLEEAINCDGKVVEVNVNSRELSAIVTFDTTAAVNEIMNKRPLTLYGFKLDVDVCRDKVDSESGHTERRVQGADSLQTTESSDELQEIKAIQIRKLPVDLNREMLIRYFESKTNYVGKVVDVIINSQEHFAIVEFEESTAVFEIMNKRPLTIYGFELDVDVCRNNVDLESEHAEREVQGAESLQKTGTNSVACAETEPDSSQKREHSDESQNKTIYITNLPGHVNREMLIRYFETNYFGKVMDVTIYSEKHIAIVEFDECAAVYKVQDKMPLSIYGSTVDILVNTKGSKRKEDDNISGKWRMFRFWNWRKNMNLPYIGGKSETSEPGMNKYKSELQKNGLTGLKDLLSKEIESLTSTEVHIAVTGASGSGKSSFINSIRGLKPEVPGAAKVGVNETTSTCNRYEHPENKSCIVWDLPGVGTPNFPKQKYLQMVGYDQYDFFIIISKDRFTEIDLWLAQEVRNRNKPCFFVRTNIDTTIENDARDSGNKHNEANLLDTIQKHIKNQFQSKGLSDQNIFLISNCVWNKYDFGILNNKLLSSLDGLKKDTLALSLSAVTREVIDEKKRVLKKRIHATALSIATKTRKPEQKGLFQDEINFYRKQFDIDEKTLSENKEMLLLTDDNLMDFRVVFDKSQQNARIQIKTPTSSMDEISLWDSFKDWFHWSKENTMLYGFSKMALENNLELLYHKATTFYDKTRANYLVKSVSK